MNDLGKLFVAAGIVQVLIGGVMWGLDLLRRRPGGITLHKGSSTFSFPIVTCLLLSAVLSLLAWLIRR